MIQPVIIGNATLYLGDCLEILPTLQGIDLVFTSPPYLNARDYGNPDFDWTAVVPPALSAINKTEKQQILVNLGLVRKSKVIRYWDALIDQMEHNGWELRDWYVWDKGEGFPGWHKGRLAPAHEWVFHFAHGYGDILKTIPSRTSHLRTIRTIRQKDGTLKSSCVHKEYGTLKQATSVIRISPLKEHNENIAHPAQFPTRLSDFVLSAFAAETVCDPFMGSGTTGISAIRLDRKFIGIEIDPDYFAIACARIEKAQRQGRMEFGEVA